MRKVMSIALSTEFKGLPIRLRSGQTPLVAANRRSHLSSSLRGSVEGKSNVKPVSCDCIPEAISLHFSNDKSLSKTLTTVLHRKLSARRLPHRLFPANDTTKLVSMYLKIKTLLSVTFVHAMTNENDDCVQGHPILC